MLVSVLFVTLLASANAFTAPMSNRVAFAASTTMPARSNVNLMMAQENEEESSNLSVPAVSATTAAIWASLSTSALADSPDWGIFEGRIGSLLHPTMMVSLLTFSVWTAVLGFQWRRQRTIGDDISKLKKTIPDLGGASSVSEAVTAAKAAESPDNAMISKLQAALSVEDEVKTMQVERKELAAKAPKDQHFSQGATLALLGTVFAIEVCKNGLFMGENSTCSVVLDGNFLTFSSSFVYRDPSTLTLVPASFSLDLTCMLVLDWSASGPWQPPWFLPCKRVTTLPVTSTLVLISQELVCSCGKLHPASQFYTRFLKRPSFPDFRQRSRYLDQTSYSSTFCCTRKL